MIYRIPPKALFLQVFSASSFFFFNSTTICGEPTMYYLLWSSQALLLEDALAILLNMGLNIPSQQVPFLLEVSFLLFCNTNRMH
jgi:hypothetical protein